MPRFRPWLTDGNMPRHGSVEQERSNAPAGLDHAKGQEMSDDYARRSYGDTPVGFGLKPGIVVVDFMLAFTDPQYPLGGAPLVLRAMENTMTMLEVARR